MAWQGGPRSEWAAGIGVALLAIACGPIEYLGQVTQEASAAVAAAKAVEADRYAPYYYTLAVEYLHKAREEAAHADYQAANRFGRRAEEAAKKARLLALERAGRQVPPAAPGGGEAEPEHPEQSRDGQADEATRPGSRR